MSCWGIQHITSSASYPQSNGRAELAVKSAKRMLRENTSRDGSLNTDKVCQALLQYRNTPVKNIGLSPAQILLHRNLRDSVPVDPSSLKLNKHWVIAAQQRKRQLKGRNDRLAKAYNSSTRPLSVIPIGSRVLIQNQEDKRWTKSGTVVNQNDRKYTIRVHESGRFITRNRRHLRKAPEMQDVCLLPNDELTRVGISPSAVDNRVDDSPAAVNDNQIDVSSTPVHNQCTIDVFNLLKLSLIQVNYL